MTVYEAADIILENIYTYNTKKYNNIQKYKTDNNIKDRMLLAIDGRCASGKTTLAKILQEKTACSVFHMDDFFLRPEQRTAERLLQPGGNVDYERFLLEIMNPIQEGKEIVSFRPYDCHTQKLLQLIETKISPLIIVEGSYSCHPLLMNFYNLKVFLTITPQEQLQRILVRNGSEQAKQFEKRWIPLEEQYFLTFQIQQSAELNFQLT